MVADRARGFRREPHDGPLHRGEIAAVPSTSLREQRVQPLQTWRTGQGRGFRRIAPTCRADEVTIPLSAPPGTALRATRVARTPFRLELRLQPAVPLVV